LLYSWTVSFAASALYQYLKLPIAKRTRLAPGALRELIRFGMPLHAAGFLWFIFTRVQTFILGAFGGPSAVAMFAVASRIPEALQQVAESYMAVYFPKMTALLAGGRQAQAQRMFETSLRMVSFGAAAVVLAGVLFSAEITEVIFSARYAASAPAFALLMIGLHMMLVVNLMGYTLTSAGHPRQSLVVDVIRTGVVLAASLALVPIIGFTGAAWARVLSSYCGAPAVVRLLRRRGPSERTGVWLGSTAALVLCCALWALLHDFGLMARFGIGVLFVISSARLDAIRVDDVRLLVPRWPMKATTATAGDSA
jgi:O-antigen/teichoic acid export membrane protein